jgi:hypothetical protein
MASGVKRMLLIDPAEHIREYSNRLDKEMNEILNSTKLSESEKLRNYLTILRRYIISKQTATPEEQQESIKPLPKIEITPPTPIETTPSTSAQQQPSTQSLLTVIPRSRPLEISSSSPPLTPVLHTDDEDEPEQTELEHAQLELLSMPDNYEKQTILKKIFYNYREKAEKILEMMDSPNSQLKYSKTTGELIVGKEKTIIPESNIYKSLRNLLNTDPRSKGANPAGHEHFLRYVRPIGSGEIRQQYGKGGIIRKWKTYK